VGGVITYGKGVGKGGELLMGEEIARVVGERI